MSISEAKSILHNSKINYLDQTISPDLNKSTIIVNEYSIGALICDIEIQEDIYGRVPAIIIKYKYQSATDSIQAIKIFSEIFRQKSLLSHSF